MGKKRGRKTNRLPTLDKTMREARFQQMADQYYHNRAMRRLARHRKPRPFGGAA